ncbi:hypothetical protein G5714_006586 [Onychostoma macrolepis]|uniref:MIF4G domain-containing protein n=1 Tax=Onychostoma macrolepis TaxID=369639 RepID=A0A7J6CXJ4_9TELE|nr:hypothetical protein G5714_006586 [Onychostoma macrolepis]
MEAGNNPSGLSGPSRSGQGQCGKEPWKMMASVSLTEDVQLNKGEKAWKPSEKRSVHAGEDEPEFLKTQELFRRVSSVLNKLTPQTFQSLMKQVTELTIDTEERLKGVVELIFEKAISEPNSSVVYANMCRCLMGLNVPTTDKPGVTFNFRKLLLNRCQKEFEKDKNDETFEKQKELDAATGEEEKQRLKEEPEDAKDKAQQRSLGNIKFIGELFKLKMLTEPIMHDCVVKLLMKQDEESLERLCCLLSTIGKDLDHEKAKPRMDQYFIKMEKIIKEQKTSPRICFMLQDLLDLRRLNQEESEQKKTELMKIQRDVQHMIQDRIKKIQDIKHSAEARTRNTEKEKAARVELFTDLIRSIERCQTELLEMMEEQQKAAEKQEQELIEELEQEITELKMRNTELEQLSHTEDHLHLLQIHSSLCSPRNTRNWPEISMKTHESLETLRRALNQLKDTIDDKLTQTELKWMQQYAVDVTLDPDTAHPELILSDDGKQPSGLRGPSRSGQGQCGKEPWKMIASVSLTEDVQLNKAEKAWKPSVMRSGHVDEDDPETLKTQELFRRVSSVLNKLTPQTFQPLMKQVTELTIDTEERLKGVVELIFEKAISEPNSSVVYANMCRCLMGLNVPTTDKPGVTFNFRKLLLNRCQKEFEKDKDDETFEKQKEFDAATGEEEKQRLKVELEDAKDKAQQRSLGNIKFIGELFKLKMLTEPAMHDCVVKLLKKRDEESLERLCCLLSTVGKDLDHEKAKPEWINILTR